MPTQATMGHRAAIAWGSCTVGLALTPWPVQAAIGVDCGPAILAPVFIADGSDDAEISAINAQDLNVDELDMKPKPSNKNKRESDIPGLDIGEPELKPAERRDSDADRKVELNQDSMDIDGGHHGEGEGDMSTEELEKHKHFEEMRKKHYEMKNIKDLLG